MDEGRQDLKKMNQKDLAEEAAYINKLFASTSDDDYCPTLSEAMNEKFEGKETVLPYDHGDPGQRMNGYSYNPPLSEYQWGVGNSIWTLQDHEPAAQALRSSTLIDTPYRLRNFPPQFDEQPSNIINSEEKFDIDQLEIEDALDKLTQRIKEVRNESPRWTHLKKEIVPDQLIKCQIAHMKEMNQSDLAEEAAYINKLFASTSDHDKFRTLSEAWNHKFEEKEIIPDDHGDREQRMNSYYYNPPLSEYQWGVGNSIWTLQNHEPAAQALRSSTLINTPYRLRNFSKFVNDIAALLIARRSFI